MVLAEKTNNTPIIACCHYDHKSTFESEKDQPHDGVFSMIFWRQMVVLPMNEYYILLYDDNSKFDTVYGR
jgi:hypothetical protein